MAPRKSRRMKLQAQRNSHFDAIFGHDAMPGDEEMLFGEPTLSVGSASSVEAEQSEMEQEQSTSDSNARLLPELIDILIGPKSQLFCVHKSTLCSQNTYFANLIHKVSSEIATATTLPEIDASIFSTITLPETDPAIFTLFIEYVYTGTLSPIAPEFDDPTYDPFLEYVQLYAFALSHEAFEFADLVMNELVAGYTIYEKIPGPEVVKLAYTCTVKGSCLRRFMAERVVWCMLDAEFAAKGKVSVKELGATIASLEDLATGVVMLTREYALGKMGEWPGPPREREWCEYHLHGDGERCRFVYPRVL